MSDDVTEKVKTTQDLMETSLVVSTESLLLFSLVGFTSVGACRYFFRAGFEYYPVRSVWLYRDVTVFVAIYMIYLTL